MADRRQQNRARGNNARPNDRNDRNDFHNDDNTNFNNNQRQMGQGQNRANNFRRNIGARVVQERRERTDLQLFKNHEGLDNFITNIDFKTSSKACVLPVSTRGVGFLVNTLIERVEAVFPQIGDTPTAELYRTALAMVEAKLSMAGEMQTQPIADRTVLRTDMSCDRMSILKANQGIFHRYRVLFPFWETLLIKM